MSDSAQRWLSIDGICTLLGTNKIHVDRLVKDGFLVKLPGPKGREKSGARYLDPTPLYVEKLIAGEALYGKLFPIPHDFDLNALFTLREFAEIMGWKMKYARRYVHENKVPRIKLGQTCMYSLSTVRSTLWKRNGRAMAHQRSPFLLRHLIEYFRLHLSEEEAVIPSDKDFLADDALHAKLTRILNRPADKRDAALKELWHKVDTAKVVARAIGGTSNDASSPASGASSL